jgi:hypothetical protein
LCPSISPSAAEREADAGLSVTPFLLLPLPALCAGFTSGVASPLLALLGESLPFVAAVAQQATANAAAWTDAGMTAAPPSPPERPRIGTTALECVAEHVARRAAAQQAQAAGVSCVHAPVAAPPAEAPMAAVA